MASAVKKRRDEEASVIASIDEIIEEHFRPSCTVLRAVRNRPLGEVYLGLLVMAYTRWLKAPENEGLDISSESFSYFTACAEACAPYTREKIQDAMKTRG